MALNQMIALANYCLLLILINCALAVTAEDYTQLPSIWQNAATGAYHALYQLELANSDKVLTLEEWASYNRRLFRLDLIGSEGRTSYITNGVTGELLRYQPFVCELIDGETSEDLSTISQLFFGYNWDEDQAKREGGGGDRARAPVSAYGLGPLWLRASRDAQKVERSTMQALAFEAEYDEFEVTMKPNLIKDQIDYKVRFYFVRGEPSQFVDFIDWLGTDKEGQPIIQARARVVRANYRDQLDESVFEIPVGYGCPRRPDLEVALDIDVGLELLHRGAPNQATLEVITSRPESGDSKSADLGAWTSSRYSMRMMRLSKQRMDSVDKTESYFATLMQFRDTQPQPGRAGKLRRIKRVWWAPDSEQGQATVYTIDMASGECRVNHQDVRSQIVLNFGGFSLSPLARQAAAAAASAAGADGGEDGEEVLAPGPMVLSVDQIAFLFSDNQDYHLIHLGETYGKESTSRRFRNRVYEKRVKNFQLTGDGALTWKGPVSIVKQISTYSHLLDTAAIWATSTPSDAAKSLAGGAGGGNLKLSSDFRQRVTILFYSEDQSRLMYKAVIELLDNHEVSLEYAHEQLDVSSCFDSTAKQTVVVKYPLVSARVSRDLQEKQAAIRSQVFVKLFSHLSSAFSSLQIYGIEPTFDVFNMRLEMSILDMPLSHTFQMELGLKLVSIDLVEESAALRAGTGIVERTSDPGPAIVQTTSSNADACADHCEHYNCLRFSYDLSNRACQIELVRERTKTIACASCQLYSYLERRETKELAREQEDHAGSATSGSGAIAGTSLSRPHFSADSIVEYLSELVDAAQATSGGGDSADTAAAAAATAEQNPLVLRLDVAPDLQYVNDNEEKKERNIITLRPSALEHDLENMQEYTRELEELAEGGGGNEQQVVIRVSGSGRSLRLQFNILLEDRVFNDIVGEGLEGVTYEECERHCETTDCRSFSYCQRDETCRINWQHQEKMIRSISKVAPHAWQCNVYSLDYLSKFEPYGRAMAPLKASSSEPARSPRDCANACMDAPNYQCQGFYYCNLPSIPIRPDVHMCYMVDFHVNSMLEHERTRLLNPTTALFGAPSQMTPSNGGGGGGDGTRECDFYSRSYLAQFDKYFARRLDLEKSDEMGVSIMAGHDLEFCAKQCVKMGCLGFDACPTDDVSSSSDADAAPPARLQDSSKSKQTQCHLAVTSIRGSQMKREPRCTTFILSDRSHFNSQKLKIIQDDSSGQTNGRAESLRPDKEANIGRNTGTDGGGLVSDSSGSSSLGADVNGKELEMLENYGKIDQDARGANLTYVDLASHWLAKLCSLILGVFLGFGFVLGWNEAYARGWIDRARTRLGLL